MGICIIAGPGHNPPIPQPNPNNTDPTINFQSITLLIGLNNVFPKIDTFLTFKKYVKTTRLTNNPHPNTKINDGFHYVPNDKKRIILVRRTIPATSNPQPKINPVKNNII